MTYVSYTVGQSIQVYNGMFPIVCDMKSQLGNDNTYHNPCHTDQQDNLTQNIKGLLLWSMMWPKILEKSLEHFTHGSWN